MARGVSQDEIYRAADALLAGGERPTVERVRQALGRGSPNTIGPLLDGWWSQLAQRLAQRLTLPDVPAPVGEAFAQAWSAALAAGQTHAEAQVAPERAALADALVRTDAAAAEARASVSTLEAQRAAALAEAETLRATLALRDQRIIDLERHNAETGTALQAQGERANALAEQLAAAQQDAQRERAAAAAERESLLAHARQAEDRAYGEVDRLRQEIKGLKAQAATQVREHATALRAAEQARRTAETDGQRAQREVATVRGRLDALLATAPAKPIGVSPRGRRDAPPASPASARRATRRTTGSRTP